MAFLSDNAGLRLISQIFDVKNKTVPLLPHYVQKPHVFLPRENAQPLPRCSCAEAGISAEHLLAYLTQMQREASQTDLHTLMVAKDGKVVLQHENAPYSCAAANAGYSFSKTVTALAVGLLLEDGLLSLDDKPLYLLGLQNSVSLFSRAHRVTLKHLLTMTSGATFAESGAATSSSWAESFFTASFKTEPGTAFDYNSMNSYILAAVVRRITGRSMCALLEERLFSKMGITNYYWELDREGIEKGGWGLYLSTEDMLKIGQLYLNGGKWQGEQLIGSEYIRLSTMQHVQDKNDNGGYAYGFQLWPRKDGGSFLFSGLFGQYTIVFPQNGVVVACTAGCNTLFQNNAIVRTTNRFFAAPLPDAKQAGPLSQRKLRRACGRSRICKADSVRAALPTAESLLWPRFAKQFFKADILPQLDTQNGVGLQPLMLQLVQNNYTSGLQRIQLQKNGAMLRIAFCEAEQTHVLHAGIGRWVYGELSFDGERYLTAARCHCAKNEDGIPVLTVQLRFPEGAN
ncbi:MAG: serine hydrolase, partial [Oscillospiraceae bacterium]|nr:serine hydrolase [Oscillospiraceae bacterium]